MSFNSCVFILAFLPVTVILYLYLAGKGKQKESFGFLLFASFAFYIYYDWKCFILMLILAVVNYLFSKKLLSFDRDSENRPSGRGILFIGILINVLVLCYFKYVNFFAESLAAIFKKDSIHLSLIMPLGISFFVFQQIAYLVDSYRKDGVSEHTIYEHLLFSFFFPCITSGPITYFSEMIPQFRDIERKKVNYDNIGRGLYLFSLGLAKKVLIAQPFASAMSTGYDAIFELGITNAFIMTLCYTFQIYFDFSGYSDMAIGVAKMINIDLPINFNSPYQAYNITDFWNRWHITLTRFLTKYVYIPLGGNRKGKIRTYINIMIVFIVSGLWHGATVAFLMWGILHGLFSVAYRLGRKIYDKWHPAIQWMITFLLVSFAWIYFGAPTRAEANTLVSKLLNLQFDNINIFIADCFNITEADLIFESIVNRPIPDVYPNFMMIVFFLLSFYIILCTENNMRIVKKEFNYNAKHGLLTVVLIVASLLSLSGVTTFIYAMF